MSESDLSSRQRSVSSNAALVPDAKRKKSLDTQRAFRARKAAHVKDLEVKVALQELEIARLKRENQALHAEIARLADGNGATPTLDATPCSVTPGKRQAKIHNVRTMTLPAVLQPPPSVLNHVIPSSHVSTSIECAFAKYGILHYPCCAAGAHTAACYRGSPSA